MLKYRKPYLLILLFCSVINYVSAQLPGMRKYTHLDGFTATNGYLINQDEKGYLWIGTDNGGIKFDGNKFKELQQFPNSSYMEITSCQPLGNNRVLLSPLTGDIIILDHDKIDTVNNYRITNKISGHNFSRQDAVTGAWWIYDGAHNTDKRLTMNVYQKKSMVSYNIMNTDFTPYLIIDNHLIGVENFIIKGYDVKSRKFYTFKHSDGSIINDTVEEMGLVIMARDYLLVHDRKNRRIKIYKYTVGDSILQLVNNFEVPFPSTQIISLLSSDKKQYIYFTDSETGRVAYYPDITADSTKLHYINFTIQDKPNSLFIDRNNNLWLTTANNALYFLSEKHIKNMFTSRRFQVNPKAPKSISGDNKGAIYISYKNSREIIIINDRMTKKVVLNEDFIEGSRKILVVNDTKFLVYNKNLALIDKITGKTIYLNATRADYKDVCKYQGSGFLASTNSVISHIYPYKNKYENKVIFSGRTSAVNVLKDGKILIGTPTGLYIKKGLNAKAVKILHPLLENSYITDIVPLSNGNTLIGTNGQGLLFYENDQSIHRIKLQNVNILSSIRQLYLQNDTTIWASTNIGGICVMFDKTWSVKHIRQYTFYDGLPSNNVTGIYVKNDTAFFATTEGLGVISISDTNVLFMAPPNLSINRFSSANYIYISPEKDISLHHNQNNFQISLSGISYESQGKVEFYYRLYPLQKQWIKTSNPEIQITNATPGNYIFEVYATNVKGIKSNLVVLGININKAFWQTIYFKIIILSIIAFAFYFFIRRQIQKSEREKYRKEQQKKHLAQLELEAIKAQINPHFIHNCLNSIQYLNYSEDYTNAQKYLDLFSQLIRKTMDYARRTFISVEEEAKYLSQYMQLEKLRFKEKFEYEIDIDKNVAKSTLIPAMLLQPYVENALKHGVANKKNGGKILVQFLKKKTMLQVIIKDNGSGFPQIKKNGTMGLRISGTRAQSYNELFNLHIQILHYNVQEQYPEETGAIVEININTIDYETAGN